MPQTDKYAGMSDIGSQPERWAVLSTTLLADGIATGLSDTIDLAEKPKGLRFNAAGNVALQGKDGASVVIAVGAGEEIGWRPKRILSTGTTVAAAQIILLLD